MWTQPKPSQKWRVRNQDTNVTTENFLVPMGTDKSLLPDALNWLQPSVGGDHPSVRVQTVGERVV